MLDWNNMPRWEWLIGLIPEHPIDQEIVLLDFLGGSETKRGVDINFEGREWVAGDDWG